MKSKQLIRFQSVKRTYMFLSIISIFHEFCQPRMFFMVILSFELFSNFTCYVAIHDRDSFVFLSTHFLLLFGLFCIVGAWNFTNIYLVSF